MTSDTRQDSAVDSRVAYLYTAPDIDDETTRLFLRRSQEIGSDSVSEAVRDYERRVEANEPYSDAIDVDSFRDRYLS